MTSAKLCQFLRCNAQVFEYGEHVLADGFVMFIDQGPIVGFRRRGFRDSSENGTLEVFHGE